MNQCEFEAEWVSPLVVIPSRIAVVVTTDGVNRHIYTYPRIIPPDPVTGERFTRLGDDPPYDRLDRDSRKAIIQRIAEILTAYGVNIVCRIYEGCNPMSGRYTYSAETYRLPDLKCIADIREVRKVD